MEIKSQKVKEFISQNKLRTASYLHSSRILACKFSILNNCLYFLLFALCRFVIQTNYSNFDLSQIEN